MITEDYVYFKVAKLLKEKGFNPIECGMYYSITTGKRTTELLTSLIACPTLQMAMKWLREEKGIAIVPIIHSVLDYEKFLWDVEIIVAKDNETYRQGWVYESYEEMCNTAIEYCLENLI